MNRFFYYVLAIPFSRLPMGVLYFFGSIFYFFLCNITPYRKKVIDANLKSSFPDKSDQEIKALRKSFYRYFSNLFVESLKLLTIKEKNLLERIKVNNPEVLEHLYQKNKGVVLISSHLNNWEYLILAQDLLFNYQAFGIGMPLTNKFWNQKLNERRERFGMIVTNAGNYKEKLAMNQRGPSATLVLNDQSPGKEENCYWTNFLNQETAFFFGAEVMANQLDHAVVYAELERVKRGYYQLELTVITDDPHKEEYGFITSKYVELLEKGILKQPEVWLWSHKRWKKTVPTNLDALKENHKERFNKRFRAGSSLRETA
ncbi:MAG: lysophospholipid acyltransferase family protein [Crocinitomicaceae bacterium]|nr:lysophospholipid acyltransferase family protein [Crocinitomicaceae bacterium]